MESCSLPGALKPELPEDPRSPSLSMLRSVWQAYLLEEAGPDDVLGVIDQVTAFIQFELDTLQKQAEQGQADPQSATFQKIVAAFELHLEALDEMALEFAEPAEEETPGPPGAHYQRGFNLALKATGQLVEAHRGAMEHIEAMAQVACIFCAQANPRESQRCSHCGRALPGSQGGSSFSLVNADGLEGTSSPAAGQVTQNYAILAEAVERWRGGQLPSEELLQQLNEVEEMLVGHQQETGQYYQEIEQAPEQAQEALRRAVAMTEEGLVQSLQALDKMKMAFEKEDDSYLETGLDEFAQASSLMVQAFQASREAAVRG